MLPNFTLEQMALLGIFRGTADAVCRSCSTSFQAGLWLQWAASLFKHLSELLCLGVFPGAKGACLEVPRTE